MAAETEIDTEKIFFKDMERPFTVDLLKKKGDFLLRRGTYGGIVLSVHAPDGEIYDFRFSEHQQEFSFPGGPYFRTLKQLLSHYYKTGEEVPYTKQTRLKNPIEDVFDLIDANRVNLEEKLDAGNLGEVWRAKLLPDNETVAVRILLGNTTDRDRRECRAEARIMSWLNHKNVVKVRGIALTTTAAGEAQLLIVNEYCSGGSLIKWLEEEKLDDEGKARSLLDMAKGIQYLHKRNIIHTDIDSRNCLVHETGNRKIVKIGDVGLTRMIPDSLTTKRKLPMYSMPPEALHAREWTKSSDVWAFGVLILEVHNKGRNPYEKYFNEQRMDVRAVIRYLNEGNRIDAPTGMPPELYEMAKVCMKKHNKRPDMDEVVNLLKNYYDQHFGGEED